MDFFIVTAFVVYFCLLTLVGLFFYNKSSTSHDFMVGNRSVNYWVTAVATQASDMGSWLFLGFPAAVYSYGLSQAWTAIGLCFFMFLNWKFIAPRLRRMTADYNSLTLASFFEVRFNAQSPHGIDQLHLVSTIITLIFFTFYISSGLVGLGRLFEAAFTINYHTGVLLGLISAIVYTLLGGFVAVAWSDFFQGMFLFFVILLVPTYALGKIGGIVPLLTILKENNVSLTLFPSFRETMHGILLACGWGLGYFGQPHVLTNYMGIDDAKKIRLAMYVGIVWQIIVLCAAIAIGLIGIAYFGTSLALPELLFIRLVTDLFHPFFVGIAFCAILAAIFSTMDSHILIAGTLIAENIKKMATPHDRMLVLFSRLGSLSVGCLALGIAYNNNSSVYDLVTYAWSGLGSSFGPLVITALYGPQWVTARSALMGMVAGCSISLMWPYMNATVMPLVPGFFGNFFVIFALSLLTKQS